MTVTITAVSETNPQETLRETYTSGSLWAALRLVGWVASDTFFYKWQRAASSGWRTYPWNQNRYTYTVTFAGTTSTLVFSLGSSSPEWTDLCSAQAISLPVADYSGTLTATGTKYLDDAFTASETVSCSNSGDSPADPQPTPPDDGGQLYSVYADGQLLYNAGLDGYEIMNPVLETKVNEAGSFTFEVPPTNLLYNSLYPIRTIVSVRQGTFELFRGRILTSERGFNRVRKIFCEGCLAFLHDSWIQPKTLSGSAAEVLTAMLTEHNAATLNGCRLSLAWSDMSAAVSFEVEKPTRTIELVKKLVEAVGGYIYYFGDASEPSLVYSAGIQQTGGQSISFGENLLSLKERLDGSPMYNVIQPIGKDGLTIPGGVIEDADSISFYNARVAEVVEYPDADTVDKLDAASRSDLRAHSGIFRTITLDAADLHALVKSVPRLTAGAVCPVYSKPHEIQGALVCMKARISLQQLSRSSYSFGASPVGLTDMVIK